MTYAGLNYSGKSLKRLWGSTSWSIETLRDNILWKMLSCFQVISILPIFSQFEYELDRFAVPTLPYTFSSCFDSGLELVLLWPV